MGIVTNDNFNINAPKVIDDRYSTSGVTPYVSVAAANAAIAISRRAIGLTVNIAGTEYWYKSGITDPDLVVKSSGSTATLPIVRNVYLVQDASDAAAMGGTPNNVYTTFQTAYAAANSIQTVLGGTNRVVINVGNTTALTVGNLTLTVAWNNNIDLVGTSPHASQVGDIIASNAVGSGFAIGSLLGSNKFRAFNITIGNIITSATGAAGNSGVFAGVLQNVVIGNIDTSITNVANTTGNGGGVNIQTIAGQLSQNFFITSIVTSSQATTSNAGNVSISSQNFSITSITTCNNNGNGSINIQSNTFSGGRITTVSQNCTNNGGFFIIRNCIGGNWTSNLTVASATLSDISECTITNLTFTSSVLILLTLKNTIIDAYISNANLKTLARECTINTIQNLGLNSRLMICSLSAPVPSLNPTINGISAGCKIINCTIEGGTFGIDNTVPVTVDVNVNSTYIETGVGANITLI